MYSTYGTVLHCKSFKSFFFSSSHQHRKRKLSELRAGTVPVSHCLEIKLHNMKASIRIKRRIRICQKAVLRIQDPIPFFDPWIRDPGRVKKNQDPDPGWKQPGSYSETSETIFRGLQYRIGVDHAGALPPGAAASEEGHDEDDHSCKKKKITLKVRRQVPATYGNIIQCCFGSGFTDPDFCWIRIRLQDVAESGSRPSFVMTKLLKNSLEPSTNVFLNP